MRKSSFISAGTLFLLIAASVPSQAAVIGDPFPIATTAGLEWGQGGAFDGTNLLVCIIGDASAANNVTAQLFTPAGSLVGPVIPLGSTGGWCSAAFDGTNFLVIWNQSADPSTYVKGQFVSTAGALVGASFTIATAIDVSPTETEGIEGASVIFDGTNYFTLWENRSSHGGSSNLYGQFTTKSGANLGSVVDVSTAEYGQRGRGLAFDGAKILAVWADGRNQNACYYGSQPNLGCYESDLYGQFIAKSSGAAAGTLSGSNFLINSSTVERDHTAPAVAFNGTNYLVVITEPTADIDTCKTQDCSMYIVGQLVDTSGNNVGGEIILSSQTQEMFFPTVASNGTEFLVSYVDISNDANLNDGDAFGSCDSGEGTCWDMWGQHVGNTGTLVGSAFAINADANNQFGAVGYFAGRYFGIVSSSDSWDTQLVGDVYGALLTSGPTSTGNLLLNPDFETGTLQNWDSSGGGSVSASASYKRAGGYGAWVMNGPMSLTQEVDVSVFAAAIDAGKVSAELGGFIGGFGSGGFNYTFLGASSNALGSGSLTGQSGHAGTVWELYDYAGAVPAATRTIRMEFAVTIDAAFVDVYWDDTFLYLTTPAKAVNDFDGDGKTDLAVYHQAAGNWYAAYSGGGYLLGYNMGWSEATPVPGDFDGDGTTDLAVYHQALGNWYVAYSSGGYLLGYNMGWSEAVPVPGDYDGDGKTDLAVYHQALGNWYIAYSGGGYLLGYNMGWSEAVPVPADYDGDGRTDMAVYHQALGNWYVAYSGGGYLLGYNMGWSEAAPVPGDYDGDGMTDLAVYHQGAGNWYVAYSGGGYLIGYNMGWSDAAPVPGDYDGDGKTDLAVYHQALGNWYVAYSGGGYLLGYNMGWSEARPVAIVSPGIAAAGSQALP